LTSGTPTVAEIRLLKGLLLVDQIRGEHATGVAKVNVRTNEVAIHKRAYNAVDYLTLEATEEFLSKDMGQLYIGHNRYATMGDKSKHENAHPFQHEHITMVHNGGVDHHALHLLEGHDDKEVTVDSQMVCMTIAKHGIKKAVEEYLSGAFALVWWDSNERSLNFIRNEDRPLWIAVMTNGSYVWASEKGMLDVFLKRDGRQSGYRVEPQMILPNQHYKVCFNQHGNRIGNVPTVAPMTFLDLPSPKTYGAADQSWWNGNTGYRSANAANSKPNTAEVVNLAAPRVNAALDKMGTKLRYRSLVTVDVTNFEPYVSSPLFGIATGIVRDTGEVVQAWGLHKDDMEGVTVIRGNVANAYHMLVKGVNEPSITIDCVGVSCHDPKYDRTTALQIRTSASMSQSAQSSAEKPSTSSGSKPKASSSSRGDDAAVAAAKIIEMRSNSVHVAKVKAKGNQRPQIHFPLKVCGHTFVTASEFREFVQRGCAQCSEIPTAYDTWNNYLCVYTAGNIVSSKLEDAEFCCGECEGVH
jgi:hypothetical protein